MLVRSGVFLLWTVGSVQALLFGDFPSCSLDSYDNFVQHCIDLCDPLQATSTDALNKTDEYIAQTYKCECGGFDEGCFDEIILVDRTVPLPTCTAEAGMDITTLPLCQAACNLVGEPLDTTLSRDVNGKIKCICQNGWGVCSDDPTCAQLQIFPGTVAEDCADLCGTDAVPSSTDEIESLGLGANKDQTHLKVACSCDGVERCQNNILFSDVAFLKSCREDLGIKNADDCGDYCDGNGFTTGSAYVNDIGFLDANCTCKTGTREVWACEDAPPSDDSGDFNGDNENSGSGGLAAAWIGVTFMSIVTLMWS